MKIIAYTILSMAILSSTLTAETKYPGELSAIIKKRARSIELLNRKYVKDLLTLQNKYTKRGDLKSANLVADCIRKVSNIPINDKELTEFLKGTKWIFSGKSTITFAASGKVIKSWGRLSPPWKVKNMQVIYGDKIFIFNEDFTEITEITKTAFKKPGKRM